LTELIRGGEAKAREWEKLTLVSKAIAYLRGGKPPEPLFVYENKLAFPRFFIVNKTRIFSNTGELLTALQKADNSELRSRAYVLRSENIALSGNVADPAKARIDVVTYSSDRIVLGTSCDSDAILIVTNNYSPSWKAQANGADARIFPVFHTFQGIYLKAGANTVRLGYKPPYALNLCR
jgi:hypothetical protein